MIDVSELDFVANEADYEKIIKTIQNRVFDQSN